MACVNRFWHWGLSGHFSVLGFWVSGPSFGRLVYCGRLRVEGVRGVVAEGSYLHETTREWKHPVLDRRGSFTDVETKSSKIPSLETLQPKTSFYPLQPLASVMSVPAVDPVSKYWCLGLRRRRIIVMDQKTTQGTSKLTLLRRDRFSIFHWQFPGVLRASGFLLRKASSLAVLRGLML